MATCSPQQVEILDPSLHRPTPRVSFRETFVTNLESERHSPPGPVRPSSRARQIGLKATQFGAKANQFGMRANRVKQKVFRNNDGPIEDNEENNPNGRTRHAHWMSGSSKGANPEGTFFHRMFKRFSTKGNAADDERKKSRSSIKRRPVHQTDGPVIEGFRPRPTSSGVLEEFQKKFQNRFPNLRSSSARDLSQYPPPIEIPVLARPSTGPSMGPKSHLPHDISATWSLGIRYPQQHQMAMISSEAGSSPETSPELPARFATARPRSKIERPAMPPPILIPKHVSRETCILSSSSVGISQSFLSHRTKLSMSPTSYNFQGPLTPPNAYTNQPQPPSRTPAEPVRNVSSPSTNTLDSVERGSSSSNQPYSPVRAPSMHRRSPSDGSECSPTRDSPHRVSKASNRAAAGSPLLQLGENDYSTPRSSIRTRRLKSRYPRRVPPIQSSFTTSFLSWKEAQFSPTERPVTSPALGCNSKFPFGGNGINSNQKNRASVFRPNDTCEEVVPPPTCLIQQTQKPPQVRLVLPGVIEGEPF